MKSSADHLGRVALVHDYLNQFGGAERVALALTQTFPGAPLYTSLYRPHSTFPGFREVDVRTSALDRLPVDRRFRGLLPLYPAAFRSLGTIDADVVISSSSAWAHAARVTPEALHVVYCYAPARWLYGGVDAYPIKDATYQLLRPAFAALRRWDRRAANRPHRYIAIAENVRRRIRAAYGFDADVVYPPVGTERFTPTPRGERWLIVSRLLTYKRVDLAVEAARRAGFGLDVVGEGPLFDEMRANAPDMVEFHGSVSDTVLAELFESCRGVILCGPEDFGLVPLEGNAAGKPAIAFAAGGALETVRHGETGVRFTEPSPEAVIEAVRLADSLDFDPLALADHADGFGVVAFRRRLLEVIDRERDRRAGRPAGRPPPHTRQRIAVPRGAT